MLALRPFSRWMDRTTLRRAAGPAWPVGLARGQIFILPTRFGFTAAGVIVALLLIALNYQNSLVFLLAFFLGSLLMSAMVVTHQQLRGLVITGTALDPVFAGQTLRLRIRVANLRKRDRQGLHCYADGKDGAATVIPGRGEGILQIELPPRARGRHTLRHGGLSATEPFAAFRAWSRLAELDYIVYPRPAPHAPPPPGSEGQDAKGRSSSEQPEDFAGLARYQPGDRPGQIAWQTYARGGELERKHFSGNGSGVQWLDLAAVPASELENQLSIMTSWVLATEKSGRPWGLRLPNLRVPPGTGHAHVARCLEALALFPEPYGAGMR